MILLSVLGSAFVHQYEKITKKYAFMIMGITSCVVLFLSGTFPVLPILFIWGLVDMFVFMNMTIVAHKVLDVVSHDRAATVLSFQSLLRRVLYAVCTPLIGVLVDKFNIQITLQIIGVTLFVLITVLFVSYPRKNT
jgi:fucose permease